MPWGELTASVVDKKLSTQDFEAPPTEMSNNFLANIFFFTNPIYVIQPIFNKTTPIYVCFKFCFYSFL